MTPLLPTICDHCGFGREHVCERSVCPCGCHFPVHQQQVDPEVIAFARETGRELLELAY
jgi:hypothetical protein